MVVHHGGKSEKADIDAALGSTAIAGAVDTQLVLKRSDKYRTLSSVQRYGEDLAPLTLELEAVTRRVRPGVPKEEADVAEAGRAILDYLTGIAEPVEERMIHDHVEGRKNEKVKALRALVKDGDVTRVGDGKRGAPYLYGVSGIQVPAMGWEPEIPETENGVSARKCVGVSGSQKMDTFDTSSQAPGTTFSAPEPMEVVALG